MSDRTSVDIAILGAGPAGLYGAYYAGFRGLSVAVLDSLPEPGGQISALYPEKPIYDVAGLPAVRGRDLVRDLVQQAAPFAPTYLLGDQVVGLARTPADRGLELTTARGHEVRCRALVLTAGIGTFRPRPLPAGESHLGRGSCTSSRRCPSSRTRTSSSWAAGTARSTGRWPSSRWPAQ